MLKILRWECYKGEPIVLCGSIQYTAITLQTLKKHKVKQIFLCDEQQKGAVVGGVPVIGFDELTAHKKSVVVLGGKVFYKIYCKQLGYGLSDFYSMAQLIEDGSLWQMYQEMLRPFFEKRKEELILPGIEVPVTQSCTYNQTPDPQMLEEAVEKILQAVDGISSFKISGGEPLLEQATIRKLLDLTDRLARDKIVETTIVTNGTLLFEEETLRQMQKTPTTLVIFSNYGALSCRQNEAIEQLRAYGIPFSRSADDKKIDIKEQKFSSKIDCCTLWNGKLFVCPVAAHGVSLNAIPLVEEDYFDILQPGKTIEELHTGLHSLYHKEHAVTACDWCDRSETLCAEPAE